MLLRCCGGCASGAGLIQRSNIQRWSWPRSTAAFNWSSVSLPTLTVLAPKSTRASAISSFLRDASGAAAFSPLEGLAGLTDLPGGPGFASNARLSSVSSLTPKFSSDGFQFTANSADTEPPSEGSMNCAK